MGNNQRGRLGVSDDPVYVKSRCFDPFPSPTDVPEPLEHHLRIETEELNVLRKRVDEDCDDLGDCQAAMKPPFTGMTCPDTNAAASLNRKTAAPTVSSGVCGRWIAAPST